MEAKKYNNIKLGLSIGKGITSFVLLFFFVYAGVSLKLERFLMNYFSNNYLIFLFFAILIFIAGTIIFFPVNYYSEFYIEHKFNLSNQTFVQWIWEDLKGVLVAGLIGLPLLFLFFYLINFSPDYWQLYFAVALFFISVILAQILPIVILPLFYKVTPIENANLKNRILDITRNEGLRVENIYRFNMSKNTRKANAAFVGLGKTKRIILGDTLLKNFSDDEILAVIAHEIGHFKKKHILKNILLNTIFSFVILYLIAELFKVSLPYFGFEKITRIAAMPLLALWSMLVSILTMPIFNGISRKFEYEADEYSVLKTGDGKLLIETLKKLNKLNLGDEEPHPLVEWMFYNHPSIKKRIRHIETFTNLKLSGGVLGGKIG